MSEWEKAQRLHALSRLEGVVDMASWNIHKANRDAQTWGDRDLEAEVRYASEVLTRLAAKTRAVNEAAKRKARQDKAGSVNG